MGEAMTTNQTIDGVPLLPCPFCGGEPHKLQWPEGIENGKVTCLGLNREFDCPLEDVEVPYADWNARAQPFAQPQGEPVAWLNVATGHVTTSAVVVMDWDDEKEQVKSLYAEQPAPVAVVIPERRVVPSPDLDAYKPVDAASWNACLDEVTRLNIKE